MSQENPNVESTGAESESDLSSTLNSGGETEFVIGEEKKPQSTQYMILGALVLLAPAALWYFHSRTPAAATAATLNSPHPAAQTVHTFLDSGQDGIKAMRVMLSSTEKIVKEFLSYPSMAQVPLNDLKTNPFRSSTAAPDNTDAMNKKKREEERAAIVKAVQGLQLQSIMSGKHSACMINNTLYTEGQQVNQFTIEKIGNGVVIVRSGQYRFELKMQK